ncbi:MAG: hypothetical protein J6T61_06270, partial [Spirochaetia bacterium]|nr:hypothetical protein [Spirochaetia bacterium]
MRRFLALFLLFAVMLCTGCESLPQIFDCPAVKQKQEKKAAEETAEPAESVPKAEPKTVSNTPSETSKSSSATPSPSTSSSASTATSTTPSTITPVKSPGSTQSISQKQKQLVEAANWAKGRNYLTVNGTRFKMDCSGVVRAIYYKAGIDLAKDFNKYKGGGTQRIHETLRAK